MSPNVTHNAEPSTSCGARITVSPALCRYNTAATCRPNAVSDSRSSRSASEIAPASSRSPALIARCGATSTITGDPSAAGAPSSTCPSMSIGTFTPSICHDPHATRSSIEIRTVLQSSFVTVASRTFGIASTRASAAFRSSPNVLSPLIPAAASTSSAESVVAPTTFTFCTVRDGEGYAHPAPAAATESPAASSTSRACIGVIHGRSCSSRRITPRGDSSFARTTRLPRAGGPARYGHFPGVLALPTSRPLTHVRVVLPLVPLDPRQPQVHDPADQRRVAHARHVPQPWEHAHRAESRQRVYLVDYRLPVLRKEQVHAREPLPVDRLECRDRAFLHVRGRPVRQLRRRHDLRAVVQVLRAVVVELSRRDHLTNRR